MLSGSFCAITVLSGTALILAGGSPQTPASASNVRAHDTGTSFVTTARAQETTPESDYILDLGGVQFDPLTGLPAPPLLPAEWLGVQDDVPDMHIVQFAGPIQASWLEQLEAAGVQVVQYIHPYAYIVWGQSDAVDAAAAQVQAGAVRWVGEFSPAFRVLPQWRNLPGNPIDVRVMIYRGAEVASVIDEIIALGKAQAGEVQPGEADVQGGAGGPPQAGQDHGPVFSTGRYAIDDIFEIASFSMPGSLFQQASRIPGVYSIQPLPLDGGLRGEMTNRINLVGTNSTVTPGYAAWLTSAGINGAGVIIANVDGGVNNTHPDLVGRFVPCVGTSCGGGSDAHGTHTAAVMAGTGASGVTANGGFRRGQGVAPGANLIEQMYSPTFQQAGGMLTLMTTSSANGALVSGNSWGPAGSPLGYDSDTRQCDVGVRDARPTIAGNQSLTYVLSIMNGNGGTSSQGTPDEGKNLFTIGSTKAQNTGSGSQITQINHISSNSGHGPCLDGRKIPHMVAPGCFVDSAVTGSGYSLMCGTSMASPHVSGAAALFIQKYRSLFSNADPSPAMVKAAFLGNAFDLAGNLDADNGTLGHPFDSKQGWGRLNVAGVVNPPANTVRYFDNPQLLNNTGEQWTTALTPVNPALPMRIMLVWTDAPGHGLGGSTPAWNNNLNLEVSTGSNTYKGNVFAANGFSVAGGAFDTKNNTEGAFLPAGAGPVTIRVIAQNITSNGVPNVGDSTDQDFALVAYNAALPVLCLADVDNSGGVDVDDLVAIILAWGPCAACPADVDDSGTVDVDDLVAVILAWGDCP
jgi:serine protease AprX